VEQAVFDGEGASDAVVAYAADGALLAVTVATPRRYVEQRLESHSLELREAWPSVICLSRSTGCAAGWVSAVIEGSARGDKTAIAVDHGFASPYRGNVYVAWGDTVGCTLAFARSLDGGVSVEPAVRIPGCAGFPWVQIGVGPDGAVHLLWVLTTWQYEPDPAAPPAAVFHARSDDGGANFSRPRAIAHYGGRGDGRVRMGIPSLAVGPGGLLLAWTEGETPGPGRTVRLPNVIRFVHSADGERWSEPAPLRELSDDLSQGLPAVASTLTHWHVLSYDSTAERTEARISSAPHDNLVFRAAPALATRPFGADQFFAFGDEDVTRRFGGATVVVGDYVGLAGAGEQLAAAFVLPETDDLHSPLRAYAAVRQTP
jgi:hypothetical protein